MLFWQGRKHSYTIRRYRQQLYRLSNDWLTWLELPLAEQILPLSDYLSPANNLPELQPISITLRSDQNVSWQVQMIASDILLLLGDIVVQSALTPILKIMPLDRNTRIQTALATRPQAGKKLYQTLGIPSWLRESLVVVSATFINAEDQLTIELPLLLLSPFKTWVLGSDMFHTDISIGNKMSIESQLILNKPL